MNKLVLDQNSPKETVVEQVRSYITTQNFTIESEDVERPWGGFYVIPEAQLEHFIETFFPGYDNLLHDGLRHTPKLLLIAPEKRLSWQYHFRRSELWKVVSGPVGVILSENDTESSVTEYNEGDIITVATRQRHRLAGVTTWGVIAEIWIHTDTDAPSNEEDIVRLYDDFGRS